MLQCPVTFGVQQHIKILVLLIQELLYPELIKPQQPIRLIQPVLAQKRRCSLDRGQCLIFIHSHISGIKHTFDVKFVIQSLCDRHDLIVALRRRTDNHLRGLSRRDKRRCIAVLHKLLFPLCDAVLNLAHRCKNGLSVLIRCKFFKSLGCGKL